MVSTYVKAQTINELLPVTLCSGTGDTVIVPANQTDEVSAGRSIRDACSSMGFSAGASGPPLPASRVREVGIPNTFSLAWRLGRAVAIAQQQQMGPASITDALIRAAGGQDSAAVVFRGKIRSVETKITATAHSLGKVIIEKLDDGEDDGGNGVDGLGREFDEIEVPFMNENLCVVGRKRADGSEKVSVLTQKRCCYIDTDRVPRSSRLCPI